MADIVLDSSAVLALLLGEPGGEVVAEAVTGAAMSSVNLAEVVTRLLDAGWPEDDIQASIDVLALTVVSFEKSLGLAAGFLRKATRGRGLSLGDRACLATARHLGLPALTCDRNWRDVDVGVDIRQAR